MAKLENKEVDIQFTNVEAEKEVWEALKQIASLVIWTEDYDSGRKQHELHKR